MGKLSDYIVDFIKSKKNKYIFGIQGTPNLPLFVSAYEKGLKIINNTSENYSIYTSIGKYQQKKELQFVFLTMGPGVLGGLKALGHCYTNNIPLFLITPYNRTITDNFGEHHLVGQDVDEIDTSKVLDSFTCYNVCLKNKNNLIGLLNKAYNYSLYYKKPVNISIPYDFLDKELEMIYSKNNFKLIKGENKILLLGDTTTEKEILELVNNDLLYFVIGNNIKSHLITKNYLGVITHDNNNFLKYLINNKIIKEILIYNLKGTYYNLGFLLDFKKEINIYHFCRNKIDICYYFLGKRVKYFYRVSKKIDFKFRINKRLYKLIKIIKKKTEQKNKNNLYYRLADKINNLINNSNIFIAVGGFDLWGKIIFNNPTNNYYFSSGYLDMGQIIKSIGYSLVNKKVYNICITGDGNFLMNLGELNSIYNLDLNITFIIINNNGYMSLYDSYKLYNNGNKYKNKEPFNNYKNNINYKNIAKTFDFKYYYFDKDISKLFKNIKFFRGRNIFEIKV